MVGGVKRLRLFLLGLIGIWLAQVPAWAVVLSQGPVVVPTATNAVVRWSTDVSAGGRVYFGTAVKQMDRRVNTEVVGTEHEATLTGLKPGTVYWYSVGTARVPLATNFLTTTAGGDVRETVPAKVVPGAAASATTTPPALASPPAKATPPPHPDRTPGTVTSSASAVSTAFDPTRLKVPPTRLTWGAPRSLPDHFERHGADFAAKSADDYAAQAWIFLRRAKAEGLPAKLDDDGVLRVYDPKSRAFASYNKDLTTKTYFKPGRRDYFDDQPGRPVDLKKLVP